jgi:hypothetical protein
VDAGKKKTLDDIEAYGCHVIYVLEEGDNPPFSYSVGVQKTSGAPEVIAIGLKQPISHSIVNEYNRRVRSGERFTSGARYDRFLVGFSVQFEPVAAEHFDAYLGWDVWLYEGRDFEVLQLIYPTVDGVWPWEESASDWFRRRQPLLSNRM